MDRRYKDYFIVTFKRARGFYGWTFLTDRFNHFPPLIKVHWRSIGNIPYALVSVPKAHSEDCVNIFKNTYGVYRVVPYTQAKEHDFLMWNKILRTPYYGLDMKYKVWDCMRKDLFIDWLV